MHTIECMSASQDAITAGLTSMYVSRDSRNVNHEFTPRGKGYARSVISELLDSVSTQASCCE